MTAPAHPTCSVDLTNWSINGRTLARAVDLALWVCSDEAAVDAVQHLAPLRFKADPDVKRLGSLRPKIDETPHFKLYRESDHCDRYHAAARAVAAGTAASGECAMVAGLDADVLASPIVLAKGQALFHGRADRGLEAGSYASYVSTSLSPTIARYHAFKRHYADPAKHPPIVYVLTLTSELPAIWGQIGKFDEHELLLERELKVEARKVHQLELYHVIEADIGR